MILDVSEAVRVLRFAFQPLSCVVGIYSNDSRVRFEIINTDQQPILKLAGLSLRDVVDPVRLEAEIHDARERLAKQGHALSVWVAPWVSSGARDEVRTYR